MPVIQPYFDIQVRVKPEDSFLANYAQAYVGTRNKLMYDEYLRRFRNMDPLEKEKLRKQYADMLGDLENARIRMDQAIAEGRNDLLKTYLETEARRYSSYVTAKATTQAAGSQAMSRAYGEQLRYESEARGRAEAKPEVQQAIRDATDDLSTQINIIMSKPENQQQEGELTEDWQNRVMNEVLSEADRAAGNYNTILKETTPEAQRYLMNQTLLALDAAVTPVARQLGMEDPVGVSRVVTKTLAPTVTPTEFQTKEATEVWKEVPGFGGSIPAPPTLEEMEGNLNPFGLSITKPTGTSSRRSVGYSGNIPTGAAPPIQTQAPASAVGGYQPVSTSAPATQAAPPAATSTGAPTPEQYAETRAGLPEDLRDEFDRFVSQQGGRSLAEQQIMEGIGRLDTMGDVTFDNKPWDYYMRSIYRRTTPDAAERTRQLIELRKTVPRAEFESRETALHLANPGISRRNLRPTVRGVESYQRGLEKEYTPGGRPAYGTITGRSFGPEFYENPDTARLDVEVAAREYGWTDEQKNKVLSEANAMWAAEKRKTPADKAVGVERVELSERLAGKPEMKPEPIESRDYLPGAQPEVRRSVTSRREELIRDLEQRLREPREVAITPSQRMTFDDMQEEVAITPSRPMEPEASKPTRPVTQVFENLKDFDGTVNPEEVVVKPAKMVIEEDRPIVSTDLSPSPSGNVTYHPIDEAEDEARSASSIAVSEKNKPPRKRKKKDAVAADTVETEQEE